MLSCSAQRGGTSRRSRGRSPHRRRRTRRRCPGRGSSVRPTAGSRTRLGTRPAASRNRAGHVDILEPRLGAQTRQQRAAEPKARVVRRRAGHGPRRARLGLLRARGRVDDHDPARCRQSRLDRPGDGGDRGAARGSLSAPIGRRSWPIPRTGAPTRSRRTTSAAMPACLAAAAIMIDYVLNVAVGISAGIGALTSSVPSLQPYTLALCLGVLILDHARQSARNRRGGLAVRGADLRFHGELPLPDRHRALARRRGSGPCRSGRRAAPPRRPLHEGVGLWLLLRAFAAGCTAMTGVEAVSNGVAAFREPVVPNAHRTLTVICLTLGAVARGHRGHRPCLSRSAPWTRPRRATRASCRNWPVLSSGAEPSTRSR